MSVAQVTEHSFSAEIGKAPDTVDIVLMASTDQGPAKHCREIDRKTISTAQAGILVAEICSAIRTNQMAALEFRTHGADSAVDDEMPENG
ncbi:MAG: hypothetical protein K2X76_15830 [Sphingomonas sp.]|nr:hypothetical protein [Sphingomonas sp.]